MMDLCDQVDELDKIRLLKMLGENIAGVLLALELLQYVEYGFILFLGEQVNGILRFLEHI